MTLSVVQMTTLDGNILIRGSWEVMSVVWLVEVMHDFFLGIGNLATLLPLIDLIAVGIAVANVLLPWVALRGIDQDTSIALVEVLVRAQPARGRGFIVSH